MAQNSSKKTRGANKQRPWVRSVSDGVSVLRLALETRDSGQRLLLESIFDAGFRIRRALQRDACDRSIAFRAASRERERRGPGPVRDRLGLARTALEHAAYSHLDAAPHLRRFATKALVMHLADSVWTATERHLFRDASGKTHGLMRVGRWFDFRRIPGRCRRGSSNAPAAASRRGGHRSRSFRADLGSLAPTGNLSTRSRKISSRVATNASGRRRMPRPARRLSGGSSAHGLWQAPSCSSTGSARSSRTAT